MMGMSCRLRPAGALSQTAPFRSQKGRFSCSVHATGQQRVLNHLPRSQQDQDHVSTRPTSDEPHTTPALQTRWRSSSSTSLSIDPSDLEFGTDPISGDTLETPDQLVPQQDDRLHQQDVASEDYQAGAAAQDIAHLVLEDLHEEEQRGLQQRREAHQNATATDSTAEERKGKWYIPPHAVPVRRTSSDPLVPRVNHTHTRLQLNHRRVLPVPPTCGAGDGACNRGSTEAPETYKIEGDVLRGTEATFYFKSGNNAGSEGGDRNRRQPGAQEGPVQGALHSRDEEQSASKLDGVPSQRLRREANDSRMQAQSARLPGPGGAGIGRVIDVASGRAAAIGLGSAVFLELLTQQSVISQLLGRFEGSRQIEAAIPDCRSLAAGVLLASLMVTLAERFTSSDGVFPRWRMGLSPAAQVWLGRAAMALFVLLLAYESVHSNRPAFGTFFYLWG